MSPTLASQGEFPPRITPAALLGTPLPQLLGQLGIRVDDGWPEELSALAQCVIRAHEVSLRTASDRTVLEHDWLVRHLLGRALGVRLDPLPASLEVRITVTQV